MFSVYPCCNTPDSNVELILQAQQEPDNDPPDHFAAGRDGHAKKSSSREPEFETPDLDWWENCLCCLYVMWAEHDISGSVARSSLLPAFVSIVIGNFRASLFFSFCSSHENASPSFAQTWKVLFLGSVQLKPTSLHILEVWLDAFLPTGDSERVVYCICGHLKDAEHYYYIPNSGGISLRVGSLSVERITMEAGLTSFGPCLFFIFFLLLLNQFSMVDFSKLIRLSQGTNSIKAA